MKKVINFLLKSLPIFVFAAALIYFLSLYYKDGQVIAGGEGSYFFDFVLLWKNYMATWTNSGTGLFATSLNFAFLPHLVVFQQIFQNERATNFLVIFSIYFLPFLAVYLLCLELKLKTLLSFLIALFYLSNPFMINFLKSINQWNMLAAYIIPSFFLIILKYYRRNLLLFFFFGVHSMLFSFTNANPPTMALYQVAIPLFIFLVSIYKEKKIDFVRILENYLVVLSSFLLFNFWWVLNWLYVIREASSGYTKQFAISWLRGSGQFLPEWWRVINLTSLSPYPPTPSYDFLSRHYSQTLVPIITLIPFIVLFYLLFQGVLNKKHHFLSVLMVIIFSFLAKGVSGQFGRIYEFMVMEIPFFSLFKSAGEKWGILTVFFLTLSLTFGLKNIRQVKNGRLVLIFLIIYVSYTAFAFTGDFIPDYKTADVIVGSRRFIDKPQYQSLRNDLNNDAQNYRILSLPGSLNYQVALQIAGKRFYTGNDPVLSNSSKSFLSPYLGSWSQRFGVLYEGISHPDYLKILGLYNLKKIVVNKDMYPWFGFQQKESLEELAKIFDQKLDGERNEAIDLYDVGENFLPRFYIPSGITYSPESTQYDLPDLVSLTRGSKTPAFFISPYEKIGREEKISNNLVKEESSQVILAGFVQNAIDEEKLRAGIMGMDQSAILFPYARWKPGSLLYHFVVRKEDQAKKSVNGDPKQSLDVHLFYANKRIFEIQKWDKELTDENFEKLLESYENEMLSVVENFEIVRKNEDGFQILAKIEVNFAAQEKRLLDVLMGDFGEKSNTRLDKAKEVLGKIDERLKEQLKDFTTNYRFSLPDIGEYEILVEKGKITSDWQIVGDVSAFPRDLDKSSDWVSFGKHEFTKKDILLAFKQPPLPNLLTDDWQERSTGIRLDKEENTIVLNEKPTVWQELKNWPHNSKYMLSFKYKTSGGKLRVVFAEENEMVNTNWYEKGVWAKLPSKKHLIIDQVLDSGDSGKWKEYAVLLDSGRNAKSANLLFSTETMLESSQTEFKDLSLEEIIQPKIFLRKVLKDKPILPPKITFQKINPSKYILEIENVSDPYFLVFSDSFHKGWKAYVENLSDNNLTMSGDIVGQYFDGQIKEKGNYSSWFDRNPWETLGKKSLPEEKHFAINGYANAWFISPEDANNNARYQLIVEYWPQRLFYFGGLVTLATIVMSSFILGLKMVRR